MAEQSNVDERGKSDLDEFEGIYQRWAAAVTRRDRAAFGEIIDSDYTFTTPDGRRMCRDDVIDLEMKLPPPEEVGGITVQRVTNDVVIVRGHDSVKGDFPPGSVSGPLAKELVAGVRIVFTGVWCNRKGGWRIVSNDAHVESAIEG